MKTCVVVDAYSSGRLFPKSIHRHGFNCIHVQSTKSVMKSMAPFEIDKYEHNLIYEGSIHKLVEQLKQFDIVAVWAGQEPGVELADQLSDALKLSTSNGISLSEARRDKQLMHETISSHNIPTAKFICAKTWNIAKEFIMEHDTWPIVLKPLRSASTQGVFICLDIEQAKTAYYSIIQMQTIFDTTNSSVLVQEYLKGSEYIVDAVSYKGLHKTIGIWKYNKKRLSGFGTIYDFDTLIPETNPEVSKLIEYNNSVLDALDIQYGPSHSEIILTNDGPRLVEVGARLNGLVHPTMHNLCLGHNQVDLSVSCYTSNKFYTQEMQNLTYTRKTYATNVHGISTREGIIKSINTELIEDIKQLPSVIDLLIKYKVGQTLPITTDLLTSPSRFYLANTDKKQLHNDTEWIRSKESQIYSICS